VTDASIGKVIKLLACICLYVCLWSLLWSQLVFDFDEILYIRSWCTSEVYWYTVTDSV